MRVSPFHDSERPAWIILFLKVFYSVHHTLYFSFTMDDFDRENPIFESIVPFRIQQTDRETKHHDYMVRILSGTKGVRINSFFLFPPPSPTVTGCCPRISPLLGFDTRLFLPFNVHIIPIYSS